MEAVLGRLCRVNGRPLWSHKNLDRSSNHRHLHHHSHRFLLMDLYIYKIKFILNEAPVTFIFTFIPVVAHLYLLKQLCLTVQIKQKLIKINLQALLASDGKTHLC